MAKPVVDGIEKELGNRARVVRLNLTSSASIQVASRYGVRGVPTLVVFDGEGNVLLRQVGRLDRDAVCQAVEQSEAIAASLR